MSFLAEALRKPTARAVVEAIFSGFVEMQRDCDQARGCLVVSGALACGAEAETVRRELARLRQAIVTAFRLATRWSRRQAWRRGSTLIESRSSSPGNGKRWPGEHLA
jgi:hypothetical protein